MSRRSRTLLYWISAALILGAATLPLLPAVAIGPWVLAMMIIGFALLDGAVHGKPEAQLSRLTSHDRRPLR